METKTLEDWQSNLFSLELKITLRVIKREEQLVLKQHITLSFQVNKKQNPRDKTKTIIVLKVHSYAVACDSSLSDGSCIFL